MLLMCRQAAWTAQLVAYASVLTIAGMLFAASTTPMTLLTTWLCLKSTNVMRLPFVLHRVFLSAEGPFPDAVPLLRWQPLAAQVDTPDAGLGDLQTQPRAA